MTDFQLISKFNWNNLLIIGLIEREIKKNITLKAMKQMWKSWKSQASNRYRYLNLNIMNMSMQCFDTVAVFWYCFSSQNIVHVKKSCMYTKIRTLVSTQPVVFRTIYKWVKFKSFSMQKYYIVFHRCEKYNRQKTSNTKMFIKMIIIALQLTSFANFRYFLCQSVF